MCPATARPSSSTRRPAARACRQRSSSSAKRKKRSSRPPTLSEETALHQHRGAEEVAHVDSPVEHAGGPRRQAVLGLQPPQ